MGLVIISNTIKKWGICIQRTFSLRSLLRCSDVNNFFCLILAQRPDEPPCRHALWLAGQKIPPTGTSGQRRDHTGSKRCGELPPPVRRKRNHKKREIWKITECNGVLLYVLRAGIEPSLQPLWPAAGLNMISCPLSLSCRRAWRRSSRDPAGFRFTHGSTRWRAGRLSVHKHATLGNTWCTPVQTERNAPLAHLACVQPPSARPLTWGFAQYFMGQVPSWHPIRTTMWVCVDVCVCATLVCVQMVQWLIQLVVNPAAADRFNQPQPSVSSGTVKVTCWDERCTLCAHMFIPQYLLTIDW